MQMRGKGPKRPRFSRTKDYLQIRYYRYVIIVTEIHKDLSHFKVLFKNQRVYDEWSKTPEITIMELMEDIFEKETDEDIH